MAATHSVTEWIQRVRAEDPKVRDDAARRLHERYFKEFCRMAGRRIGVKYARHVEPDEVANAALQAFYAEPRDQVTNRAALWGFLAKAVECKALNAIRKESAQKRGGGRVESLGGPSDADGVWEECDLRMKDAWGARTPLENTRKSPRKTRPTDGVTREADSFAGDDPLELRLAEVRQLAVDQATTAAEMIASLDEELRGIALWALAGDSDEEIATKLGVRPRQVRRKMRSIEEALLGWVYGHAG